MTYRDDQFVSLRRWLTVLVLEGWSEKDAAAEARRSQALGPAREKVSRFEFRVSS
ncbi:MAG: hypothetical protein ACREA9_19070 [Pyrinomonadaceae bacterium]